MARELKRIKEDKHQFLAGVCAGIAYHFGVSTFIVRFIALLFFIIKPALAMGAYVFMVLSISDWDETPADFEEVTGSEESKSK